MKEVFRASSPARVSLYQTILENAGIPCFVRNESVQQSIVGGLVVAFLPLPDFWPTLCVLNNNDYPDAMTLLNEAPDTASVGHGDWKCPTCGETVPDNFAACWNCEGETTNQK